MTRVILQDCTVASGYLSLGWSEVRAPDWAAATQSCTARAGPRLVMVWSAGPLTSIPVHNKRN